MRMMKAALAAYMGFFLISLSHSLCHPEIDTKKRQYIIGYGSLINEQSKRYSVTGVSNGFPVKIKGFRRGWFHIIKEQIFLGSVEDPKYGFNAVVFSLDQPEQIRVFDKREIDYCRKLVPQSKIKILTNDKIDGEVWIYVSNSPKHLYGSNHQAAIEASYLYTFLSGCLNIQQKFHLDDFLENCIKFTYGVIPKIKYDLDHLDKIKNGRTIPVKNDMEVINTHICSDKQFLADLEKDSVFYRKICE